MKLEIISNGKIEETYVFLNDNLISEINEIFINISDDFELIRMNTASIKNKYINFNLLDDHENILTEDHISEFNFSEQFNRLTISQKREKSNINILLNNVLVSGVSELYLHIKGSKSRTQLLKSKNLLDNIELFKALLFQFDETDDEIITQIFK